VASRKPCEIVAVGCDIMKGKINNCMISRLDRIQLATAGSEIIIKPEDLITTDSYCLLQGSIC